VQWSKDEVGRELEARAASRAPRRTGVSVGHEAE